MSDKSKKIDKQFILSDSTVNEYGFRLLTSGYQLALYAKNPIGYYMHQREDGVSLRWDNLAIDGDNVVATPVINLSNARGQQMLDEVENGFLNAASVGHIVVLEYSLDPALTLEGQTGPTITKWYNKECSLVDIPGNCNALTNLYDAQDNLINLADFSTKIKFPNMQIDLNAESLTHLNLSGTPDAAGINSAIANLAATAGKVPGLEKKIADLEADGVKKEVIAILDAALKDKKITAELKGNLATDYAAKPAELKKLVDAMPAYQNVTDLIKKGQELAAGEAEWDWAAYEKNDPKGKKLQALKADNPDRYKAIYDARFKGEKD